VTGSGVVPASTVRWNSSNRTTTFVSATQLTATILAADIASGGRTVTALRLDSNAPGIWDTTTENIWWALGVATSLDGALLNAPGTMAVNFPWSMTAASSSSPPTFRTPSSCRAGP